jgi:hypothetical protein
MVRAFGRLFETVLLVEAVHTSTGVNQLLLAGVERVTLGADFDLDILLGRSRLDHRTAGATDSSLLIVGMDAFSQCCSPLSIHKKGAWPYSFYYA